MKKRFEAKTLEEVFELASKEFNLGIDKLKYDVVQYPSKGILGLFSKKAIIDVLIPEKKEKVELTKSAPVATKSSVYNESKEETKKKQVEVKESNTKLDDSEVINSFYEDKSIKNETKDSIDAETLESEIKRLFKDSCYNLDTIEVDIEDNTAFVFIDGDDAALLIGKEGYRYNALSYLLFNWINSKYDLYLKLEIAQFLASQQDMIVNQLKPVVEHVNRDGWGRTRELNGILVQIALEYLRDTFPNKYVAIKRTKSGERYIVINEFNKR